MRNRKALKKWLWAGAVLALLYTVYALIYVDTGFATKAHLRFYRGDKPVDFIVTDESDLRALKSALHGFRIPDKGLSCGFGTDQSVTMTNGRRSITLCPACDEDACFQIGSSDWFLEVSETQRERFDAIVKKYGMVCTE